MKSSKKNRLTEAAKCVLLEAFAKNHGLHPNTVRKWCREYGITLRLVRQPNRYVRQALSWGDAARFTKRYFGAELHKVA